MNPFESLQSLAMLWGKTAGEAFADAGQNPFKGASPAPSDAGYEKARQAFARSWSTAQDLSTALARGLQAGSGSTQSDPVAAEMLAKIFDPRGWLTVVRGNPASAVEGLQVAIGDHVWISAAREPGDAEA